MVNTSVSDIADDEATLEMTPAGVICSWDELIPKLFRAVHCGNEALLGRGKIETVLVVPLSKLDELRAMPVSATNVGSTRKVALAVPHWMVTVCDDVML